MPPAAKFNCQFAPLGLCVFVYMLAYITQCFRVLAFPKYHALIVAEHPNRVATFNIVPFRKVEAMIRWKVQGYLRDSERRQRPDEGRAGSAQKPGAAVGLSTGRERMDLDGKNTDCTTSPKNSSPGLGSSPHLAWVSQKSWPLAPPSSFLGSSLFLSAHRLMHHFYWGLGIPNADLPSWTLRMSRLVMNNVTHFVVLLVPVPHLQLVHGYLPRWHPVVSHSLVVGSQIACLFLLNLII